MTQIERALGGYALLTLAIASVVAVVTALACRRLETDQLRPLLWGGLAGSIICILGVTLQPSVGTPSRVELIPFSELGTKSGLTQMVANLLLTAPSGLLCALATRDLGRSLRVGLGLCFGIEVVQLALPIGRIASVEDAVVSSAGWVIGALAAHILTKLRPRRA